MINTRGVGPRGLGSRQPIRRATTRNGSFALLNRVAILRSLSLLRSPVNRLTLTLASASDQHQQVHFDDAQSAASLPLGMPPTLHAVETTRLAKSQGSRSCSYQLQSSRHSHRREYQLAIENTACVSDNGRGRHTARNRLACSEIHRARAIRQNRCPSNSAQLGCHRSPATKCIKAIASRSPRNLVPC